MLSIYNDKGEDMFEYLEKKVMLQDVMTQTECGMIVHSDFSLEVGLLSPGKTNMKL